MLGISSGSSTIWTLVFWRFVFLLNFIYEGGGPHHPMRSPTGKPSCSIVLSLEPKGCPTASMVNRWCKRKFPLCQRETEKEEEEEKKA